MSLLVIGPVLIPLLTSAVLMALWSAPAGWQRIIGVIGSLLHVASAVALVAHTWEHGVIAMQSGGWPAPFGITLVADLLSATLVLLTAVMGLIVMWYSLAEVDDQRQRFGYYSLLHVLLLGVCGAFLTGDVFNLFVFFEVMLIASFVLVALGGESRQLQGALTYVTLNLFASALFLAAVGVLHGAVHTLNMADLHVRLSLVADEHAYLLATMQTLFLVAFGVKAAIFPLFFWLPASYTSPPPAVSAIFAGLLTKVGVYSLFRVFTVVFPTPDWLFHLVLIIAAVTMVVGVLGAVAQMEFRQVLAFHSISQIGYMVMGVGLLAAPDPETRTIAVAAMLVYMVHHGLVKGNLFLISGAVHALRGTFALKPLGGLAGAAPWLAALFLITALSLAGIPPLSGFWAKFIIIRAGFDAAAWWATAAALATGLLTLLSMVKIWNEAFWKPAPAEAPADGAGPRLTFARVAPIAALVLLITAIGVYPSGILELAHEAARQALDVDAYVAAVNLQNAINAEPLAAVAETAAP